MKGSDFLFYFVFYFYFSNNSYWDIIWHTKCQYLSFICTKLTWNGHIYIKQWNHLKNDCFKFFWYKKKLIKKNNKKIKKMLFNLKKITHPWWWSCIVYHNYRNCPISRKASVSEPSRRPAGWVEWPVTVWLRPISNCRLKWC
jgi:hypothetical protein